MGEYKFSGIVDKNKVFIINHSEITERIDPIYFKSVNELVIVKKTSNPVFKLSEVVNMKRGRFGHRPRNDPKFYNGEYPFIQTGDIVKASKKGGQIPYSQTLNELGLKTSRLFEEKAIIITIAANIGDTAILDYPACFPDSLIAMTPKEEGKLQLEYLNVYFKFLRNYLNDLAPQAAQKNINYQQLAPTPIVVPPIDIQKEIVTLYKNAYTSKQLKEKEAKKILASVDTYLLNELGITLPEKDNSLESRIFNVNFSEVSGERLDAVSSKSKDYETALVENRFGVVKLKKLVTNIKTGSTPHNKLNPYSTEGIPFLRNTNLQNGELEMSDVKYIKDNLEKLLTYSYKNEVIICIAGTVGESVLNTSEEKLAINQNITALELNTSIVNPDYLNYYFNTELSINLVKRECSIATIFYINNSNLLGLKIPLPPLEKQNEIATHISDIRVRAKQLKKEAKDTLKIAKLEIEQLILGNK